MSQYSRRTKTIIDYQSNTTTVPERSASGRRSENYIKYKEKYGSPKSNKDKQKEITQFSDAVEEKQKSTERQFDLKQKLNLNTYDDLAKAIKQVIQTEKLLDQKNMSVDHNSLKKDIELMKLEIKTFKRIDQTKEILTLQQKFSEINTDLSILKSSLKYDIEKIAKQKIDSNEHITKMDQYIEEIKTDLQQYKTDYGDVQLKLEQMFALYKYNSKQLAQLRTDYNIDDLENLKAQSLKKVKILKYEYQLIDQLKQLEKQQQDDFTKLSDKLKQIEKQFEDIPIQQDSIIESDKNQKKKQGFSKQTLNSPTSSPRGTNIQNNFGDNIENLLNNPNVYVYQVDDFGYLLDQDDNYLLDDNAEMIKLNQKQIEFLRLAQAQK